MTNDRIFWKIPQRVVILKAARDASIETVQSDTQSMMELVNSGTPPVHMIFDVTDIGMIPPDMEMTGEILSLFDSQLLGQTVIVGFQQQDMQILRSARDAITHLTGKPIEFANTFAEALAYFKQHDPTLDV